MPNMWNSDGSYAGPGGEEAELRVQGQLEYFSQVRWRPEPRGHGYRGTPITAAEDFAQADIEAELEDLI